MDKNPDRDEAIKTLWEKIKDVKFAMLTTQELGGMLRSRPMTTLQTTPEGELWFFSGAETAVGSEIERSPQVNLSYAAPDKNVFVSVSGKAAVVRDKQKAKELWNPLLKAWFPNGVDDPDLVLLRVTVEQAEYWDAPSSKMVMLAGMVKALATGGTYDQGENAQVSFVGGATHEGPAHSQA